MSKVSYRAGIVGLGFIGAGDQVSGDALGQRVRDLDGTHAAALSRCARIELVAGSSRDSGRRARFQARYGARTYRDWREMLAGYGSPVKIMAGYDYPKGNVVAFGRFMKLFQPAGMKLAFQPVSVLEQ